jgi:glycogen(starch) synthase
LLCIGRVVEDKGFDLAILALPEVVAKCPLVKVMIAGDGPARPELEKLAYQLGVEDHMDFLGWIKPDRIPALINRISLVLMPSRWQEAFGIVALQATQMARPVIGTRTGGLPEVVIDGKTGLLVEKENPKSLANAIIWMLASPAEMRAMGKRAREYVSTKFSLDAFLHAYHQLYRKIIEGER